MCGFRVGVAAKAADPSDSGRESRLIVPVRLIVRESPGRRIPRLTLAIDRLGSGESSRPANELVTA
jgi:hypothetical protein